MNIKTTILLFLLLAGVGSYVYFTGDKNNSDDPGKPKAEAKTLLDLKDKDQKITAFSIKSGNGKELVASKSNGSWTMTKTGHRTAGQDQS